MNHSFTNLATPYLAFTGASPFFVGAGLVLGLVFSVTLVSGTVWCVQITMARGFRGGLMAGTGIAMAQGAWSCIAAGLVFALARYSDQADWAFRFASAGVIAAMALAVIQSRKITSLEYAGPLRKNGAIFRTSFGVALTMPMRLAGYMALLIACSLHLRTHGMINAVMLAMGVAVGSWVWWFNFVVLARLFGKRVPEAISLRSMNRLRLLALAVFLGLFFICTAPLLPGFS